MTDGCSVLKLRVRIPPEEDPIRQLKFVTHHRNEPRPRGL